MTKCSIPSHVSFVFTLHARSPCLWRTLYMEVLQAAVEKSVLHEFAL